MEKFVPGKKGKKIRYASLQCCGSESGIQCLFDPLDPGSGIEKKIRIRDEHPGSYFRELRNNY
jgi:hypothetical protein